MLGKISNCKYKNILKYWIEQSQFYLVLWQQISALLEYLDILPDFVLAVIVDDATCMKDVWIIIILQDHPIIPTDYIL